MHTINGFVFGNMPMMTMNEGERVRWYLMSMGNEVDLHTSHWHGNTVLIRGMRTDVSDLLPAEMQVADMVPDDPGYGSTTPRKRSHRRRYVGPLHRSVEYSETLGATYPLVQALLSTLLSLLSPLP